MLVLQVVAVVDRSRLVQLAVRPAGRPTGRQLLPPHLPVPHRLHQRGEVLRDLLPPPVQGQGWPQAGHLPPPGHPLQGGENRDNLNLHLLWIIPQDQFYHFYSPESSLAWSSTSPSSWRSATTSQSIGTSQTTYFTIRYTSRPCNSSQH